MNHQKVTSSNGFPSLCCVFVEPFIHKSSNRFLPSEILDQQTFGFFHDLIGISVSKFAMETQSYFRDDALTGGFFGKESQKPGIGNRYF